MVFESSVALKLMQFQGSAAVQGEAAFLDNSDDAADR